MILEPLTQEELDQRTEPRPTKGSWFFCGWCTQAIPIERKWFLKLYQQGPDSEDRYLINAETLCPNCNCITTIRRYVSDLSHFIEKFNLYTDTLKGNDVKD